MTKRTKRWPIWRIVVATVGCALAAVLLLWLSRFADRKLGEQVDPLGGTYILTIPNFLMMLSVAAALLCILGVYWLVMRVRDARIPPWQKRGKKKRR